MIGRSSPMGLWHSYSADGFEEDRSVLGNNIASQLGFILSLLSPLPPTELLFQSHILSHCFFFLFPFSIMAPFHETDGKGPGSLQQFVYQEDGSQSPIHDDGIDDKKRGTGVDAHDMFRMGKKQETRVCLSDKSIDWPANNHG